MSSRKRKKRGKQRAEESAALQGEVEVEAADGDAEAEVSDDVPAGESEGDVEAMEAVEAEADGGEPSDAEAEAPAVSEISELKPRRKRKRKGEEEPETESQPEQAEVADAELGPAEEAEVEEDEDEEAYGDDAAKEAPKTRAQLKRVLESLIFVSDQVITAVQLGRIVKTKVGEVREALAEISIDYEGRGIELVEVNGGYQFRSVASSGPYVRSLVAQRPVRLTRAQLETLALIAYRQPITRPEVDDVRGVDSGSAIKVLLERELIKILGRKEDAGRPLLYGTTPFFLEFFGMNTMQELPTLREFTELSDEHQELFKRKTNEIGDLSAEADVPVSGRSSDPYVENARAQRWNEEPAAEHEGDAAVAAEEASDAADGESVIDAPETLDASDAADAEALDEVDERDAELGARDAEDAGALDDGDDGEAELGASDAEDAGALDDGDDADAELGADDADAVEAFDEVDDDEAELEREPAFESDADADAPEREDDPAED